MPTATYATPADALRAGIIATLDTNALQARDRALVLDLLAEQHALGRVDASDEHPAFDIPPADFGAAWDALVADGLACTAGLGTPNAITPAGLARHAEAWSATEAMGDRLGVEVPAPAPSLPSAFARRRALFGPVAEEDASLRVSVDGEAPISWPDFCAANSDAFDPDELDAIRADLVRDGTYTAGGGALPEFEIAVVRPLIREAA